MDMSAAFVLPQLLLTLAPKLAVLPGLIPSPGSSEAEAWQGYSSKEKQREAWLQQPTLVRAATHQTRETEYGVARHAGCFSGQPPCHVLPVMDAPATGS